MPDDNKKTVDFGSEYADRIAAAKARVPKTSPVPIPRLDLPPPDPSQRSAAATAAKKVLTPEQQQQLQAHGSFMPGVGSAYAVNQPGMNPVAPATPNAANPDGFVNPPRPPGSGLRPETMQQLKEFEKAAAAEAAPTSPEVSKIIDDVDDIDNQYDTDEFGKKVRSIISNKDRRNAIEKRCTPMVVEDLILNSEVRQVVPIMPGQLSPTYRSVSGEEDLFIKRWMSSERGSETYILNRYSLLNLTAGLYAINGRILPSHLDKEGDPTRELFETKLKAIARYPVTLLEDLSVNYVWFTRRVQKLLVVDNIKGF